MSYTEKGPLNSSVYSIYVYRICLKMVLRILCHGTFSGSYEQQMLDHLSGDALEDILHDLHCHAHGLFGETMTPIHATLTKIGWCAIIYQISSLLDGQLVRKTANVCRDGYELALQYYSMEDMEELKFVYDHLKEHYKFSRHPMPLQKQTI